MRKTMNARIRRKLLMGVSTLALAIYASSTGVVHAEDGGQPQIWVELGGQWNRLEGGQEAFAPSLLDSRPAIFAPSQKFERMPLYSIDEEGSLSFRPEGSDWIFSASIRYGRSASKRHVHQQTTPPVFVTYAGTTHNRYAKYAAAAKFADTNVQNSEHHLILDFQAGKDVGLGTLGGSSVLTLGVRFAQFGSKSNIALKSAPDWHFYSKYFSYLGKTIPFGSAYHANSALLRAERSFHGVGPSISWNGSAPIAGRPQASELTFDWGINAALLFGRQRTKVHHQTTAQYHGAKYPYGHYHLRTTIGTPVNINQTRSHSVMVPNVGGFAGISFRYAEAKVSFGYRADMFFGAMDGGIDTRKSENRGFFGPYASISVGLGD